MAQAETKRLPLPLKGRGLRRLKPKFSVMRHWLPMALLCLGCLWALTSDAQQDRLVVTVTAYSSGWSTAAGTRPRPGILALSRDVERLLGLRFGDRVALAGQPYIFADRMPWPRWHQRVDVYIPSRLRALDFGIRHNVLLTVQARQP